MRLIVKEKSRSTYTPTVPRIINLLSTIETEFWLYIDLDIMETRKSTVDRGLNAGFENVIVTLNLKKKNGRS